MATVAAGQVWTLLGAKDLGVGHTDAPNMKRFIAWADRQMGRARK